MADRVGKTDSTALYDGPRAVKPEEYASAISLINRCLRPNGPPSILKEYPLVLGKENLTNMRVIVHEDRVVSHAAVYFQTLRSGKLALQVGGIGSVATHPEFRGKGLASAVVEDCIRIMTEAGCHLAVLWTQRHSFYRRFGFESAGSEYLFQLNIENVRPAGRRPPEFIPYSLDYLPEIINIHERELLRTERSRREYEVYFSLPKTKTLLAVREGNVTAYAVMGKGEDFPNCVHEWGGDSDDVLWVTRKMTSSTRDHEIIFLAPSEENEMTKLLQSASARRVFEYLAMMKVVNAAELSSVISHHFFDKDLKFKIVPHKNEVSIELGNECARLANERMLVRLLFGPDRPAELLKEASSATSRALKNVFPIPLFIWGLDSV
jgi:N-acetylglutamate synthase-like GNAT family acetyltransferase